MPKFSNTRLSDTAIRNLKPGRERYEVLDASQPGFGIRVSKTGIKSWIVYGRINGKRSRKTLGTYPSLSLADARIRAREALQSMRDGDQVEEARPLLFTDALELWYEREQSNRRSFNNVRNAMSLHVVPDLRGKLITDVSKNDLLKIIDRLYDEGKPTQGNRVRAFIKRLFAWAAERDLINVSPALHLPKQSVEASRDRVLTQDELVAIWAACDELRYPFGPMIKLLLLTGQRRTEAAGACWSEIDLKKRTWTISKERSKNGLSHIIHLSDQAIDLLMQLPRHIDSDLLFTVTGSTSASGFSHAKKRLDKYSKVSGWRFHDLRRTFATHLVEHLGVAPMVVDKILNHQSGVVSGIAAVYQRQQMIQERRAALEAWSAYVRDFSQPISCASPVPI